MTEQELDALVKRLENVSLQVGVPSRTVLDSDVIRSAASAITTLRAQLAAETARADRAEAEWAAQIERDAGIADDHTPEKHSGMTLQAHVTGRNIAAAIRAQPHDRTALDAVIRAAKVEAWRKAEVAILGLATGREYQTAILALIERNEA